MIAFLLFVALYVMVVVIQAFAPYIVRATIAFGVTLPPQLVQDIQILTMKKRYTTHLLTVGMLLLMIVLASKSYYHLDDTVSIIAIVIALVTVQLFSFIYYLALHNILQARKKTEQWTSGIKQIRAVDLSARKRDDMLPIRFFIVLYLPIFLLILYTWKNYALIGEQVPVHWGLSGEPDSWVAKNYVSVMFIPIMLLFMQTILLATVQGIKSSAILLQLHKKEQSLEAQIALRKIFSYFMFGLGVVFIMLMGYVQLSLMHSKLAQSNYIQAAFMTFTAVIIVATMVLFLQLRKYRVQYHENIETSLMDYDDDVYWKLGMFYSNSNDPSLFVEKRNAMGWTINLGNIRAYTTIVLPLLGMIIFALWATWQ